MAPGADAVGLVDGDQRGLKLDQPVEDERRQGFGREIQQIELAVPGRVPHGLARVQAARRVEPFGAHAARLQRLDLVAHQRDQRRDDDGEAFLDQGRDLVAQALAAAGRQHGQHVAAFQDRLDDVRLLAPEGLVAEDRFQHGFGLRQGRTARRMTSQEVGGHDGPERRKNWRRFNRAFCGLSRRTNAGACAQHSAARSKRKAKTFSFVMA